MNATTTTDYEAMVRLWLSGRKDEALRLADMDRERALSAKGATK